MIGVSNLGGDIISPDYLAADDSTGSPKALKKNFEDTQSSIMPDQIGGNRSVAYESLYGTESISSQLQSIQMGAFENEAATGGKAGKSIKRMIS